MKVTLLSGRLNKSTAQAVGWDIYASEGRLVAPHHPVVIPTGVRTKMEGCFALIQDRSGLAAKFGVSRRAGVIDPDYDKEWGVVLVTDGVEAYQVNAGDRIGQVIFLPLYLIEVVGEGVEVLGVEREFGFGSTGK